MVVVSSYEDYAVILYIFIYWIFNVPMNSWLYYRMVDRSRQAHNGTIMLVKRHESGRRTLNLCVSSKVLQHTKLQHFVYYSTFYVLYYFKRIFV